jgi:hypothetical protein
MHESSNGTFCAAVTPIQQSPAQPETAFDADGLMRRRIGAVDTATHSTGGK